MRLTRGLGTSAASDFIYQGDIFAFLPNSSLGEYEQGSDNVIENITTETKIYAAHRLYPPGVPVLGVQDVEKLKTSLLGIRDGSIEPTGIYPVSYPVSESVDLLAEPSFLQNWDITYPELSPND